MNQSRRFRNFGAFAVLVLLSFLILSHLAALMPGTF